MSKKKKVNPNHDDPLYYEPFNDSDRVIRINPSLDNIMKTNKVVKLNRHVRIQDSEIEELMGVLVPFKNRSIKWE